MEALKLKLLEMRHARAIANIYQYAACANREAALDGWLCNWTEAFRSANAEAEYCEKEIALVLNGVTPEEIPENSPEYRISTEPRQY